MKLYYFRGSQPNFGDDLNRWLWPRLWPNYASVEFDWLIGIGTILDGRLEAVTGRKLVCGTGYRPSAWVPVLPVNTKVLFVRGPLTEAVFGLERGKGIGDPGILVAKCYQRSRSDDTVKFMPHYHTARRIDCRSIAELAGLELVDPRGDTENVLSELAAADRVIVESLHGAIVADALGIPWLRVKMLSWRYETPAVAEFKWLDWARSVQADIGATWDIPLRWSLGGRRAAIKNALRHRANVLSAARALKRARDTGRFQVSREEARRIAQDRMLELIR